MTDAELIRIASDLAEDFRPSDDCEAGDVACALVTRSGRLYTGVCVNTNCSLGFCAEHAAVAEMLKSRESEIDAIVAVKADGKILAPCGRCRELLWQVTPKNGETRVILGPDRAVTLGALLPHPYLPLNQTES